MPHDADTAPVHQTDVLRPPGDRLPRLLSGADHDPHGVLGAHPDGDRTIVRTLRPHASAVTLLLGPGFAERHEMRRIDETPVFAVSVPGEVGDYRVEVRYGADEHADTHVVDDPYRWLPTLGEMDLHLIAEGRHERLWEVLGARVRTYGGTTGTSFAVWAPNARGVRVCGDFDGWTGEATPMRSLGGSGVWEVFLPGVGAGTKYKYRVLGRDGQWREKADPLATATERPPATASIVTASDYEWGDAEWLAARDAKDWTREPMSVYEVHLGSWQLGDHGEKLGYHAVAQRLVDHVTRTGFTHVELLPVAEHPFGGSWGYQVTSYYAPSARYGSPDELRHLIDELHQAGIGVIVDWVPAHFPRDAWALARFDGGPLYEHADPRRGEQPDWGTLVFDFGRPEVRNFLVANALYWIEEYHVDGLRVDAVASMLYLDYSRAEGQWVPNAYGGRENLDAVAFLQELNATVYKHHPGAMTIAEESTSWPGVTRPTHLGGLGFGFKWNMGWMHDTLDYVGRDPVHRTYHHNAMTFSLVYAWSENYVLPLSHDEVVHGKGSLWTRMPGDDWNKAASLRAYLAFMWAHPGKQLLFMGGEFGQVREWAESGTLDWRLLDDPLHRGVMDLVGDLNAAYRGRRALYSQDTSPDGFRWIDANDAANNVLSFVRHGDDGSLVVCVANFAGVPHEGYRVGLPRAGRWVEIVNTDAEAYGGSGVGNLGEVTTQDWEWHGQPASALLRVPPSGVLWLAHDPEPEVEQADEAVAEPAGAPSVERVVVLDAAPPSASPVAPSTPAAPLPDLEAAPDPAPAVEPLPPVVEPLPPAVTPTVAPAVTPQPEPPVDPAPAKAAKSPKAATPARKPKAAKAPRTGEAAAAPPADGVKSV